MVLASKGAKYSVIIAISLALALSRSLFYVFILYLFANVCVPVCEMRLVASDLKSLLDSWLRCLNAFVRSGW